MLNIIGRILLWAGIITMGIGGSMTRFSGFPMGSLRGIRNLLFSRLAFDDANDRFPLGPKLCAAGIVLAGIGALLLIA